jgi:hypothetical protein
MAVRMIRGSFAAGSIGRLCHWQLEIAGQGLSLNGWPELVCGVRITAFTIIGGRIREIEQFGTTGITAKRGTPW